MPGEEDILRLCRIGPYAAGAATSGAADSDSAEAAAVAGRPDCAHQCLRRGRDEGVCVRQCATGSACVRVCASRCACVRARAPVTALRSCCSPREQACRPGTRKLPHSILIASSCTLTSSCHEARARGRLRTSKSLSILRSGIWQESGTLGQDSESAARTPDAATAGTGNAKCKVPVC